MTDPHIRRATARVNGVNIFYFDTGGNRPTMLCLHGRWGRAATWVDLMNRYRNKYRIIAPDQRGHGLSDKPKAGYTGEDMAADMHELIKMLNCGPVVAVGHSMGGRIAAYLAALYPRDVRALAILDESAEGPENAPDISAEEISPVDRLTAEWPTPYSTYDDAVKDLSQRFRETNIQYFLDSLYEVAEGFNFLFSGYAMNAIGTFSTTWFYLLPRIKCPVLLVRAEESWCLSREAADKMVSQMPNCTYYEVSNSDHMVYGDNPDGFYPGFERFLNSVS